MKREGTYTFSPRVVHSRTSFLDITSAIYNYEACYRSKELHLRERILFHRAAVNFEKDLRQISSSWFSQHNADALINVNEHSLLLGQRLAPRHQLTMNDFRVAEYPFGVFRWDLLKVLEVDIGDYLLVRNHNINRYRPEHLNDPMNYFFVDVKRFIRIAAKEKNTKLALKLIDRVIDYTSRVETELSFDDQDRLFIARIHDELNQRVKPHIIAEGETAHLRGLFESLQQELLSVIDVSYGITHFAYQARDINPHAPSALSHVAEADLRQFPSYALRTCAKSRLNVRDSSDQQKLEQRNTEVMPRDPFYRLKQAQFVPNTKLLSHCHEIGLMEGLSEEEKQAYVTAVAHIDRLLDYYALIQDVLVLFEEAGQYRLVMLFQTKLDNFLNVLNQELNASKGSILRVVEGNYQKKEELLKKAASAGVYEKVFSKIGETLGLYVSPHEAIKHFIHNQDIRHIVQPALAMQAFDVAASSTATIISKLAHLYERYHNPDRQIELTQFVRQLSIRIEQIKAHTAALYGIVPVAKKRESSTTGEHSGRPEQEKLFELSSRHDTLKPLQAAKEDSMPVEEARGRESSPLDGAQSSQFYSAYEGPDVVKVAMFVTEQQGYGAGHWLEQMRHSNLTLLPLHDRDYETTSVSQLDYPVDPFQMSGSFWLLISGQVALIFMLFQVGKRLYHSFNKDDNGPGEEDVGPEVAFSPR